MYTGWWFGIWIFMTFHILGIIIPTDFYIFPRGRYTTNQYMLKTMIQKRLVTRSPAPGLYPSLKHANSVGAEHPDDTENLSWSYSSPAFPGSVHSKPQDWCFWILFPFFWFFDSPIDTYNIFRCITLFVAVGKSHNNIVEDIPIWVDTLQHFGFPRSMLICCRTKMDKADISRYFWMGASPAHFFYCSVHYSHLISSWQAMSWTFLGHIKP